MKRIYWAALICTIAILLSACQPTATVTPASTLAPKAALATVAPTSTTAPTQAPTLPPTRTLIPTPDEVAPEATFAKVGQVAMLQGSHDVEGKAMVAGLQTLIIQGFKFDGKGPEADVRLVLDANMDDPAAIILVLEPRVYDNEMIVMRIPTAAGPGTANSVAIYCPETGETYASAKFQ